MLMFNAGGTNRTERLAKALKESRPDFTLHNARIFARTVIDAPDGIFSAKPLKFLPQERSNSGQADERDKAPVAVRAVLPDAEFFRINPSAIGPNLLPLAAPDALSGDLVAERGGGLVLYLGNGRVFDGGAVHDDLQKLGLAIPDR
ncbi:hypothetical protein [Candidatus Mycobacterium methanotrophicum]|uniref:Uncharacterized protein n=1 Tax=Candidatus Mycobacterium methanotrophicum TaxID=2943498 RepID=A0ABY4QS07_9MYCO|nr:hypothetical protein [Candidatus Mycobacterium methanotrophicum]UQX13451.1 hypothetical protein M5I08_24925 [Candidatus Mycobacterium methanotrophicum]